jgi:hypothetical protein
MTLFTAATLTPEEREGSQLRLSGAFPVTDLVITTQMTNRVVPGNPRPRTERLLITGEPRSLNSLTPHLECLLQKGVDPSYFWSDITDPSQGDGTVIILTEARQRILSRLELLEVVLRRDLILFADLLLSPIATLEVVTPNRVFDPIRVGLPVDRNGTKIVGLEV